ncbi:MAG: MBL fold metallo-hydrolase [Acidobacteria bacterium]|nr:MBL fold metallo-hydrolase [Acidobacteriota bacterium]
MKRFFLLLVILLVVGFGLFASTFTAKPINVEMYKGDSDHFATPEKTALANLPETTLSIIKCGKMTSKQAYIFRGGSWSETYESGMAAVLIRHPQATFIFDAGFGINVDEHIKTIPALMRASAKYDKETSAAAQLQAQGISPNDIKMAIISHSHWDHVSGLEDFPQAETWLAKDEEAYIHTLPSSELVQHLSGKLKWHPFEFTDSAYENFDRSLDLFKDGSIVLVPLPGHTPGSVGMFVNLRSGKRLLFIGDLTWAIEGEQIPTERPWMSRKLVDLDEDGVRRSIVKVHLLMKRYPELIVVPAHDRRIHNQLANFPATEK